MVVAGKMKQSDSVNGLFNDGDGQVRSPQSLNFKSVSHQSFKRVSFNE